MQVTSLKTKACWLNRLSLCQRKACSGSKLLDLLVQTLLFYACCFADKTGYYKSKLTSITEDPGCHRLSLCTVLCRSTLDEICGTACSIRSTPQYRSVMRRVTLCCWNSEWCHSTSFIAGIPIQQRKFFSQIFYFWFVWEGNTYESASIVSKIIT